MVPVTGARSLKAGVGFKDLFGWEKRIVAESLEVADLFPETFLGVLQMRRIHSIF